MQRGVFRSLVDLQAAINRYLGEHNRQPKPFVWTADPDHIIEKVKRGYQAIASEHSRERFYVVMAWALNRLIRSLTIRCAYLDNTFA